MRRDEPLFSRLDGFSVTRSQQAALEKEIAQYDPDALLGSGVEGLLHYFEEKYEIDVPVLDESRIEVTQEEIATEEPGRFTPIRRVGTAFTYHVPYAGFKELFSVTPSSYSINPPRGTILNDELQIRIERWGEEDRSSVRSEFEGRVQEIRSNLEQLRKDFAQFNRQRRDFAGARIEARKKKLLADRATVASLGYPVRQRPGAAKTYALPVERRKPVARPPRASAPFQPEPEFETANYERALEIIASMAQVLEQSPATFSKFTETDLRNQFLIQLNGQFVGDATGETFRAAGKTDIVILVEGRAVFIAECKFYDGPKSIADALDQLLGYTTWRDTKLAILVFSRQQDFTAVLRAIDEAVGGHASTLRKVEYRSESGFRYVLRRKDDPEREMTLTVLAFAIPPAADG